MRKHFFLGAGMIALLAVGAYGVSQSSASETGNAITATPTAIALPTTLPRASVSAQGSVVPVTSVALNFLASGRVADVMVHEGSDVSKGTPLARLDTQDLELGIAQAEATLHTAQANYDNLRDGASPQEIAAAQAQVVQAQAQKRQAAGSVTAQDIAAAKARIAQANAALHVLQAGPKSDDVAMAQSKIDQSTTNLQTQRDTLSAAKTNAELAMNQATNNLTDAQAAYATAKANWEYVQETGADPTNPKITDSSSGKRSKNKLNDVQKQQYYDAFVQAGTGLQNAESVLQQAQVAYDTARQQEVTGIANADMQVRDNQTELHKLQQPVDADKLAAAHAELADAQAQLAKLQGDGQAGSVAAAQAGINAAQSNLAKLQAGSRPATLAQAQAQVESAQVVLEQAQLALQHATIIAPVAGTVAELNIKPGEQTPDTGVDALVIADLQHWKIETTDLTELSVVNVKVGAPAKITLDALSDFALAGTVSEVKSIGKNKQGDITYTVVVTPDHYDARLRWNMTATITITP